MSRAMHLLITTDAVGGVWTHALELGRGLMARGVSVTLAVLGPPPTAAQRAAAPMPLHALDVPLDWLAASPAEVQRAADQVAALAARVGADVIHLNSPALAAIGLGRPVVAGCHSCLATWWQAMRKGAWPDDFAWRIEMPSRGYRAADALVAPTRSFADATRRAHDLPSAPIVVPNGRSLRRRAAWSGHFAFAAGRLWDEGKGIATLDKAAALLDAPVFAAGSTAGPAGQSIAPRHLRLLGPLDDAAMEDWLSRGPVFVSAARYEPFGLAVLEAAQAGCALVLSDIASFRELWDGAALFVPPEDARGFAAAIGALLRDPARRAAFSHAAAERAQSYSASTMAERMHAVHARVLRQAKGMQS
ncbi:glycosyltransferase family 4 protein [Leptolyngbya sp. 15MV]|nr:glycosyltransferase family 4 protein [Leptolyngbya sp. 15MV]